MEPPPAPPGDQTAALPSSGVAIKAIQDMMAQMGEALTKGDEEGFKTLYKKMGQMAKV